VRMSKNSEPRTPKQHPRSNCQRPNCVFLNMEVFVSDPEFSDIEIFQHSGKGIPLHMTGHKNCLQPDYNNGQRILSSELNEITSASHDYVIINY
jgi:hypothetical protein